MKKQDLQSVEVIWRNIFLFQFIPAFFHQKFDMAIEEFPIIQAYYRDICAIFEEIRCNVPLCLIGTFSSTLNSSFLLISKHLNDYIKYIIIMVFEQFSK